MTQILVMSQKKAEDFIPETNKSYVCISITDPEGGFAYLKDKYYLNIFRLQFHDIDKNIMESLGNFYFGMNEEQVKDIKIFLNKYWDKIDYILIHCHAGISRSAGIAAAIEKFYSDDDSKYFGGLRYVPNMRCYRLLLEELNNG